MDLTSILVSIGAPILKEIIGNKLGSAGGAMAGAVVDTLAERLGVEKSEGAIAAEIQRNPNSAEVVRQVDSEFRADLSRIAEANRDMMLGYQSVLKQDAQAEGWLQARWRPLFAIVFTLCFFGIVLTICRAIWISQLTGVEAVGGLLITLVLSGCAVLGVQVYQRTEEKKAGV